MFEGRCCYYWVMRRNVVIQRAYKMDRMKGNLSRVIIALSNYQLKTPCRHLVQCSLRLSLLTFNNVLPCIR